MIDDRLPTVVLCDIDGTLAHMKGRSPYDWSRVGDDEPDPTLVWLVHLIRSSADTEVIFLSGRDAVCADETQRWIAKQLDASEFTLLMRGEGDRRKDSIVKRELYEEYIKGKYNVRCVLDDRDQVVQMWRELGLKCLQVAPGDF